jgi:hypothetical protein
VSDRIFSDNEGPWLPPLEPEGEAFDDEPPTVRDPDAAAKMADLVRERIERRALVDDECGTVEPFFRKRRAP